MTGNYRRLVAVIEQVGEIKAALLEAMNLGKERETYEGGKAGA